MTDSQSFINWPLLNLCFTKMVFKYSESVYKVLGNNCKSLGKQNNLCFVVFIE